LDGATLGIEGLQVDLIGVDLEGHLALRVVDSIHGHREEAIAWKLNRWMLLAIILFEFGRSAHQVLCLLVKHALHFLREISIGEPDSQLLRVDEASSSDADQSIPFGRTT